MTRPRISPTRTHLALFVTDPEVSARWYTRVLGMHESARADDWIMMSFEAPERHHDIALIRAGEGAHQGGLGLQHYGLEIDGGIDTLRRLYGWLLSEKVEVVKITDHEIGNGLYFLDPDGNRLEFFIQTEPDDQQANARFKAANAPSRPIHIDPL